ncbi:DUF6282 family protein [Paenibacillus sp. GCM10027627]|uniref:DUF6282 family protein n=1 Tax=unclassified Paenibacillus TaxID=185978 RepID=UPI00363D08B8
MIRRESYPLTGIIDMHVHSAPDVRQRSHNDFELAEDAVRIGAKAVVIKSHLVPTMDRAYLVQKVFPDVSVFGSVTLNYSVGGINPYAVKAALQLGAKTVWLPTLDAANHRMQTGGCGGIELFQDGKTTAALIDIFRLVSEFDAILATGHLSPLEIFKVADEAKKYGVQKLVVTHPEFSLIRLTYSQQRDLTENYGVYLERTYAQPIGGGKYTSNLLENVKAIEAVGPESTIVATDSGQIENPPWRDTIRDYVDYLLHSGLSPEAVDRMTKINPARLLNLK